MKLSRHYVEKPWGRTHLPSMFDAPQGKRIGEVWFTGDGDEALLAKYIFTSERLSIQVHPNDERARERGLASGKTECWYILEAEEGATLGLGLRHEVSAEELRSAALDGSIEALLDWRSVRTGDFYLVSAGTIHAIGGKLALLEFQQNMDVTYRLYDYGSARELHLDDAVAVADRGPYSHELVQHLSGDEERILVDGPQFTLVQTAKDVLRDQRRWVIPLEGQVRSEGDLAVAGECLLLDPNDPLVCDNARMLIGAAA
jgi:mannose-6-phosphate isomerase